MKRFLTNALSKIFRFFWSWGFLKFILWTVTLIIFLYVEEDWRGARAWAATKAKWEARGESFDPSLYIPKPIPDNLNLGAIPLFRLEKLPPDANGETFFDATVLRNALQVNASNRALPPLGDWQHGHLPDIQKIDQMLNEDYRATTNPDPNLHDPVAQLDALYPFLASLRSEAASRPLCQFQFDTSSEAMPAGRSLTLITLQIASTRILTLHAILELSQHQPGIALDDIFTNLKLISGAKQDPSLVGGLVAIGMFAIGNAAIYDGISQHAWNDAQLERIELALGRMDYLEIYQFAMRAEGIMVVPAGFDWFKRQRPDLEHWIRLSEQESVLGFWVWPDGWIDQNKSDAVDTRLTAVSFLDPATHRAFPEKADTVEQNLQLRLTRWDANTPWHIFSNISSGPTMNQAIKFAVSQVWLDQARIACALERYRLVHNSYPQTIEELAPAYIDQLPHDIMNGETYHYRLRADGTFLLYSVGWNQIDDGGIIGSKANQVQRDDKSGDWVWPTPHAVPAN